MARFRVTNYLAWQLKSEKALGVLKTVPRQVSPLLVERVRAEILIQMGRLEQAMSIVDEYLAEHPRDEGGSFTGVKSLILAKAGRDREAEDAIRCAAGMGKGFGHFHHTAYNVASAYAALNKPERAVEWLEITADNGFPNYTYFKLDPNLDNLRDHTAFCELLSMLRRQWNYFKIIG